MSLPPRKLPGPLEPPVLPVLPPPAAKPRPRTRRPDPGRARARVLSLWRGLDYAPLEAARSTPARNAAELLPDVLRELRLESRQIEAEVIKVWNSLLDPVVTAHAQPTGLNKGTLFVSVDSNVWLAEIVRYRRREILARLQHSFGTQAIQKISFRLG